MPRAAIARLRALAPLLTSLLVAGPAEAAVTVTYGMGAAVESADRKAEFLFVPGIDFVPTGAGIRQYTEDGLLLDVRYMFSASPDSGLYRGRGTEWVTISTTDGQEFAAIEFQVLSGSQFTGFGLFYWEAHDDGAVVGSGILTPGQYSFIGFVDPAGLDQLRVKGFHLLADAETVQAFGFHPTEPLYHHFPFLRPTSISIDNLLAEVATDSDQDGRLGRFDNCPSVANPDQADSDFDGQGDVCDAFPQGGSELTQCLDDLAVLASDPRLADSDADGEDDASDRCPGTAAAVGVDEAGCSLVQFCSAIDARGLQGRLDCDLADWRNDEPRQWRGDCKTVRGVCNAR